MLPNGSEAGISLSKPNMDWLADLVAEYHQKAVDDEESEDLTPYGDSY